MLDSIFRGYPPGAVCTGAIHSFGLDSSALERDGWIRAYDDRKDPEGHRGQWIFRGRPGTFEPAE